MLLLFIYFFFSQIKFSALRSGRSRTRTSKKLSHEPKKFDFTVPPARARVCGRACACVYRMTSHENPFCTPRSCGQKLVIRVLYVYIFFFASKSLRVPAAGESMPRSVWNNFRRTETTDLAADPSRAGDGACTHWGKRREPDPIVRSI